MKSFKIYHIFIYPFLFLAFTYPFHQPPISTFYNEWFFATFIICVLGLQEQPLKSEIKYSIAFALIVCIGFIDLFNSTSHKEIESAFFFLTFILIGYFAFIIGTSSENSNFISYTAITLIAAGLVSVIVGIYQWLGKATGQGWQLGLVLPWDGGTRVGSNIGQANNFGTLMVICLWATYYLKYRINSFSRLNLILLVIAWVVGIYISGSRTALLNIIIAIPLAFTVTYFRKLDKPYPVLLPLVIYFLVHITVQTYNSWFEGSLIGEIRSLTHDPARIKLWQFGWEMLKEHWTWGAGNGNIPRLYLESSINYGSLGETIPTHVHNTPLNELIAHGIIFGSLLIGFFIFLFWKAIKSTQSSPDLWLLMIVAGISIHAMLEYPLNYGFFFWLYCLLLGSLIPTTSRNLNFSITIPKSVSVTTSIVSLAIAGWVWHHYSNLETLYTKSRNHSVSVEEITAFRNSPGGYIFPSLSARLLWGVYRVSPDIKATEWEDLSETAKDHPYPDLLWKAAVGSAFLGNQYHSAWWLERICAMFPSQCAPVEEAWLQLSTQYHDWPLMPWIEWRHP